MVISDLVTSREKAANSISTDSWCSCIDGALTKEHYIDSIKKLDLPNVVYTKGLQGFSGIVGLNILFLTFISGGLMNPARSLVPTLLSGIWTHLWLYWTSTFVGTSVIAWIY